MYRSILLVLSLSIVPGVRAASPGVYKVPVLSVELARKAAWHALLACRKKGYSVAVAVVDRGGNLQAFYRALLAGPHTVRTALRKAWTANSFRQHTSTLALLLAQKKIPSQVQHNPGALLVGGGMMIRAGGRLLGAIGVAGAPPGKSAHDSIDHACAKAGIEAVRDVLDFE